MEKLGFLVVYWVNRDFVWIWVNKLFFKIFIYIKYSYI